MSQNNDADNVVTISDAPVQFQSNVTSEEQAKQVKAKGDRAQQKAIREANEQKTDVPITEQPQTLNTDIIGPQQDQQQPGINLSGSQPQSANTEQQQAAPPTDSENINVEEFNKETANVIGEEEKIRQERAEKKRLLDRAIKSLDKKTLTQKINVTTNELVAEYIEYLPDENNKTVYDYMKDPFVQQHIAFQFPEGAKEGDKLKAPITPYWTDANF